MTLDTNYPEIILPRMKHSGALGYSLCPFTLMIRQMKAKRLTEHSKVRIGSLRIFWTRALKKSGRLCAKER